MRHGWWAARTRDGLPRHRLSPLDRFRTMQVLRLVAVALVLLCGQLAPASLGADPDRLLPLTAAFIVVAVAAGLLVRFWPPYVVVVARSMVVVDAVWATTGMYLTGGPGSPLAFVLLLHLAAVTLVASYRTGLGLALLDTVLLAGGYVGVSRGWWEQATHPGHGSQSSQLVLFLAVLWLVALGASTLSVTNERELKRRRRDLDALTLLTERVERSADPATVAQTMLDAVLSSYGLRRGVVLASRDGTLPLLASAGLGELAGPTSGASPAVARTHESGDPQLLRTVDPQQEEWLLRLFPTPSALVVVPLFADARPLGALVVEHTGRLGQQRRLLPSLARSAAYGALALRNAWLMKSVQLLAATDPLTKIGNRRAFEYTLEREIARAVRGAEHVSLVMVDLDNFKHLNDTLGHQAGDEVLRNAASALVCECREFDTAARYGGEEFAVILPGVGPEEAYAIAERLRCAVGQAPALVKVTASAGVATFPGHGGDAESLLKAADEALYVSKRTGRDRTSVSAGVAPEEQVQAMIRRAVRERLRAKEGRTDQDAMLHLFDS